MSEEPLEQIGGDVPGSSQNDASMGLGGTTSITNTVSRATTLWAPGHTGPAPCYPFWPERMGSSVANRDIVDALAAVDAQNSTVLFRRVESQGVSHSRRETCMFNGPGDLFPPRGRVLSGTTV